MLRSVYIISGCKAGTTFEYRVLQKQEQLATYGIHSLARQDLTDREKLFREVAAHDILYLYRMPYGPIIEGLIEQARGQGMPVIFDTDDLVFEPDLVHHVDPVRAMDDEEAALYYEGVWRYRRMLLASDAVVTSTEYLADKVRALGKRAFVHRNGLSKWMITAANESLPTPIKSGPDKLVLGYGSGTATHRKDLAEIAGPLAQILANHSNTELHIVGALHLDANDPFPLPEEIKPFADRIQFRHVVSWADWFTTQKSFDINLAPLERDNPFCEAKSEIKYTEAAIVGIPTVASRIRAFDYAIRDGETGFLAGNSEEWTTKLEALLSDPALRRQIGAAARTHVLTRYTPERLGSQLVETLTTIQATLEQERPLSRNSRNRPLVLNWIFPEPLPGSGGHTNIIRMMNLLSGFGHHVNAYIVPRQQLWDKSDLEVREFTERHLTDINGGVFKWSGGPLVESDAVILTHWSTTYMVENVHNTSKIFYFVQDWEPFFFPMGTEYLRAEQTYKMGFSCITLGRWLTQRLREWYDAEADYFDLAVDHTIYYPRPVEKAAHPRICFYARPSTPRRLFPIGVEALQLVHQRRQDAEIILYGVEDAELRRYALPFPYTNRGILNEHQLAELFSACDMGIVLSPTNCSLVPPEMMACRCAVVDLNSETVSGVLEHEVNALLAEPTPEALANAVLRLLEDKSLCQRLVETAQQQIQERSWLKSAHRVEELLYQKLPTTRRNRNHQLPAKLPALDALPQEQQQRLNNIHTTRRRAFPRAKAIFKTWGKYLLGVERGVVLNGAAMKIVGELTRGREVGQRFVAMQDDLYRIDVLFATHNRRNTRDIIFHLKEDPTDREDLATVCLNASFLIDQGYASFVFTPQPESRGKSYYFCIESPESIPGDAVALWTYRDANVAGTTLTWKGRATSGHLVFGLFYLQDQLGQIEERPLLFNWARVPGLWQRIQKAYRILATQGLTGLQREVNNYWKWITRKR